MGGGFLHSLSTCMVNPDLPGGLKPKVEFCRARPRVAGLVIEQYALLCVMRVHPPRSCVLSPLLQRKGPCKQPPLHLS